jgi:hypothetical protein
MRRLFLPSVVLVLLSPVGLAGQRAAQRPFSVFGGLALATDGYGLGFQIGGSFTVPISSSVGFRLDGGFLHFRGPPVTDSPAHSSIDVLNGTASIAVLDPSNPKGPTWSAGAGVYRLLQRGNVDVYPGLNARAGIPLSERASLGVGFHVLLGRTNMRGFLPIALELQL